MIILFFVFSNKNGKIKNTTVKKEEIILQYENELKQILKKHESNKEKRLQEKKIFLQKCNSELSRNIFFTHEESVKIIQRFSIL